MQAEQLVRQLRILKRTLEQLETEFAHQHIDRGLLADIDRMVEDGLANDTRTEDLGTHLERLRESTLTPRSELFADGIRDCRRVKALIEELVAELG